MYGIWRKPTKEGMVSLIWARVRLRAHETSPTLGLPFLVNGISFPFVGALELLKDGECIDCSYQKLFWLQSLYCFISSLYK